jgi:hypothetical protein
LSLVCTQSHQKHAAQPVQFGAPPAFFCSCTAAPKPDQSDKPDFNGTWTLDLKGDARATVETLRGMRVAHYYGIDLSQAALEPASKALKLLGWTALTTEEYEAMWAEWSRSSFWH